MRDGFGSPAIMPGTAIVMHGTQAFGRSRPVRTRCGCLITGSIATADMCWWKDTGGKENRTEWRSKRAAFAAAFFIAPRRLFRRERFGCGRGALSDRAPGQRDAKEDRKLRHRLGRKPYRWRW